MMYLMEQASMIALQSIKPWESANKTHQEGLTALDEA